MLASPPLRDLPKGRRIAALILTILLALVFVGAGTSKLMGQEQSKEQFRDWRLDDDLRPVVGAVEVLLAVALLLPWTRFWGAAALAPWMVGAIVTHLRVAQYGQAVAPLVLGSLGLLAAYLLMPQSLRHRLRPAP